MDEQKTAATTTTTISNSTTTIPTVSVQEPPQGGDDDDEVWCCFMNSYLGLTLLFRGRYRPSSESKVRLDADCLLALTGCHSLWVITRTLPLLLPLQKSLLSLFHLLEVQFWILPLELRNATSNKKKNRLVIPCIPNHLFTCLCRERRS